jgi:hypothetical protein
MGLVAYVSVAVFYALFDLLAVRGAFYTVNLLGRAVFRGLRDPAVLLLPVQLDFGAIARYNLLHLGLSLLIGLVVVRLIAEAERRPAQAPAVLAVIVAGFVATILVVGLLTQSLRPVLPWWSIVAANSLAVIAGAAYVLRRHPGVWRLFFPGPGSRSARAAGP